MYPFFIDAHCDSLMPVGGQFTSLQKNDRHFDFKRAVKNGAGVQVLALFSPRELPAYETAIAMLDFLDCELSQSQMPLFRNVSDLQRLKRDGSFGVMLSLEGCDALCGDLSRLDFFYNRGVRLLGLTWNNDNALCGGIGANESGLTPLGIDGVRKWEALGGIIDVSHASDSGFSDALITCAKPVIASHSCCKALCGHPRNLTDAQIRALSEKGGVMGINFFPEFLTSHGTASIEYVTAHILHAVNIGGEDAVGFGSDFDGIPCTPVGLTGVQDIPALISALEAKKVPPRIIEKIMGGNFLRIFGKLM